MHLRCYISRLSNLCARIANESYARHQLLQVVADPSDKRVPEVARAGLAALGNQLLKDQIVESIA